VVTTCRTSFNADKRALHFDCAVYNVFSVVCTIMANFDFGGKEPSGSAIKELFN